MTREEIIDKLWGMPNINWTCDEFKTKYIIFTISVPYFLAAVDRDGEYAENIAILLDDLVELDDRKISVLERLHHKQIHLVGVLDNDAEAWLSIEITATVKIDKLQNDGDLLLKEMYIEFGDKELVDKLVKHGHDEIVKDQKS